MFYYCYTYSAAGHSTVPRWHQQATCESAMIGTKDVGSYLLYSTLLVKPQFGDNRVVGPAHGRRWSTPHCVTFATSKPAELDCETQSALVEERDDYAVRDHAQV